MCLGSSAGPELPNGVPETQVQSARGCSAWCLGFGLDFGTVAAPTSPYTSSSRVSVVRQLLIPCVFPLLLYIKDRSLPI